MKANEKVDAVIVGSGAASSVYAALLAEAGKALWSWKRAPPASWKIYTVRKYGRDA